MLVVVAIEERREREREFEVFEFRNEAVGERRWAGFRIISLWAYLYCSVRQIFFLWVIWNDAALKIERHINTKICMHEIFISLNLYILI